MGSYKCVLALFVLFAAAQGAIGQVGVGLKPENATVLLYERVPIQVTILNRAPEPMVINRLLQADSPTFDFEITDLTGRKVARARDGMLIDRLFIGTGEQKSVTVDLARWYPLREQGGYIVTGILRWGDMLYKSRRTALEVVDGIVLNSVSSKVAGAPDRTRTYSLRYWDRKRKQYLFLRIDETPTAYVYGCFELGPLIRFHPPTISVSPAGLVTVHHQIFADCFVVSTFRSTKDGVSSEGRRYETIDGRPYVPPEAERNPGTTSMDSEFMPDRVKLNEER